MKYFFCIYLLFLTPYFFLGQEVNNPKKLNIKLPSEVTINGTSTLHDWVSNVEKTDASMVLNSPNDTKNIESLEVMVEVLSIKSGKKLMDKLTYKALKAEEHPIIKFIFKKGELVSENGEEIKVKLNGDLTIAGVTKNVTVLTNVNKKGKDIYLKGNHDLKMTDFGIKPPKALFGTIKTGDEITIKFNLKFN